MNRPIFDNDNTLEGIAGSIIVAQDWPPRVDEDPPIADQLDEIIARIEDKIARNKNRIRQYVCSEVSIFLNGRRIKVPEAAYSDLCYLQSIAPPDPQENGSWMVRIDGGSAGESYKVELILNDTKLLERRLGPTEGQEKITETKKF